jgi:hypothetical protein
VRVRDNRYLSAALADATTACHGAIDWLRIAAIFAAAMSALESISVVSKSGLWNGLRPQVPMSTTRGPGLPCSARLTLAVNSFARSIDRKNQAFGFREQSHPSFR